MPKEMLLCSALLLLAACSDKPAAQAAEAQNSGAVTSQNGYNAADTEKEWQAKASARGAEQAARDIRGGVALEEERQKTLR